MEMHPLTKLLVGLFAVTGIACVIWIARYGGQLEVETSQASPAEGGAPEEDSEAPTVSSTGPHPKAAVDEPKYDFGTMAVGESLSHNFEVRNEGEAPLVLKTKSTSCKCTGAKVPGEPIAPGESAPVVLTWEAAGPTDSYLHGAELWTNDPDNRVLRLQVAGVAEELVHLMPPGGAWTLGVISDDSPKTISGTMFTRILDEFHITGPVESSSPHLTAEVVPLSAQELEVMEAKSGYEIRATFDPQTSVGPFREVLTIPTDIPDVNEVAVSVEGVRKGPMTILAPGSAGWNPDRLYLNLGRFTAEKGIRAKLIMFVTPPQDGTFEVLGVTAAPSFIKATVARDEQFRAKGREKYNLEIAVPPGSPPVTRSNDNPAKVTLKTNHPQMPEIAIRVRFTSR